MDGLGRGDRLPLTSDGSIVGVVVYLLSAFRRSDIPLLQQVLASNRGRSITSLFACHSSPGNESHQSKGRHRIAAAGFPQFLAAFFCLLACAVDDGQDSWV